MFGVWGSQSSLFLYVLVAGTFFVFALPMFLVPLRWAATLGWEIPGQNHLSIYYGRCLASVMAVLCYMGFVAAGNPTVQPFYFNILLGCFGLMIVVHAYGGIRKIQPLSETIETGFWLILFFAALLFYPV
ncbi:MULTISPECIES: hypothetical protein [Leptospira]|uniref:DUF1761 domain-containing protein n=2 Tax=Leptospira TaxID=171 RepID=A0A2M9XTY5_9LEPT|nr:MULTISPECIES: hypothetical protein [Leptospira]AYV54895.1 hypothetical protein EFP84_04765 [Leptospira kmetyi]EQA52915.1 hypothetical protein LEP1GSC052_0603 [Leptospira kmetyi serovar Malaysia str. Bejo-Iso9]PJZ30015.1 hypothetical protein CH378_09250 [Leptospira kmetyi]PJZ42811.1 hypothetical protein CH370_06320 [Leptospira kmetyi]TGK13766.1 hypothetical protein EHO62_17040 [Leptospira kmetyi]